MAGDWIKVRCDLQTHPKVVRILSAMRRQDVQTVTDKFRVIGGLHAVWTVFDQHSTDGALPGYTPEVMDHIIGWDGFCQAMIDVGWLVFDEPETLVMPEFEEHNGKSGKRRAEDQKRKRKVRKASGGSSEERPNGSGQNADKKRTRGEERRVKDYSPNGECASPAGESPDDPPALNGSKRADRTPYQEIIDLYRSCCPSLPDVVKLTPARRQAIRARCKNELPTLDDWQQFFRVVQMSDFLTGRVEPSGGRSKPFVADIDFLIKQGNCVKIMEGKYDD